MITPKYCGEKRKVQEHLRMCYVAYLGILLSERCRLLMSSVSYFPKRHACNLRSTPAFPFLVCASCNHKNRDHSTKNNKRKKKSEQTIPGLFKPFYLSTQTSILSGAESSLTLQSSRVDFDAQAESEEASEASHSLRTSHIVSDSRSRAKCLLKTGGPQLGD